MKNNKIKNEAADKISGNKQLKSKGKLQVSTIELYTEIT